MRVKCPKCNNLADSQPSCCKNYRKIIKCYGLVNKELKTKIRQETCGFKGFVKIA